MIPVERSHLDVVADSHAGLSGKNNEDQFSVSAYRLNALFPIPSLFAVLADGIGGHRAGEVAAEIAVEMVSQAVAESDASQPTAIMQAGIILASQSILAQSDNDPKKQGMGTTCVCAWIIGNRLYAASVGNSRLYLIRNRTLSQLTTDHTWVQEALEAGALTKEQAREHPHANIIRRYLGSPTPVEVDLRLRSNPQEAPTEKHQGMLLKTGDRLLLCSDGLSDMVEDSSILEIAAQGSLEEIVPALIDQANQNGGKDNVTVVAIDVPEQKGILRLPFLDLDRSRVNAAFSYIGLGAIGFVLVSALMIFGWQALFASSTSTPTVTPTATPRVMVVTPTP